MKWFVYKIHLIVDSVYELPVAYSVTKASVPDVNEAHHMTETLKETRPFIFENAETMQADKGYDDTQYYKQLWVDGIKPIIAIRNIWKDGENTRLLGNYENVVHIIKATSIITAP